MSVNNQSTVDHDNKHDNKLDNKLENNKHDSKHGDKDKAILKDGTLVELKLVSIECKHKTYATIVKLQTGNRLKWGSLIEFGKSDTGENKLHYFEPPARTTLTVDSNKDEGIKLVVYEMHHLLHRTESIGDAIIPGLERLAPNEEHFMRLSSNLGFFSANVVVKVRRAINQNERRAGGIANQGDINLDRLKIKHLKEKIDYNKRQHAEEISQIHAHYKFLLKQNNIRDHSNDPRGTQLATQQFNGNNKVNGNNDMVHTIHSQNDNQKLNNNHQYNNNDFYTYTNKGVRDMNDNYHNKNRGDKQGKSGHNHGCQQSCQQNCQQGYNNGPSSLGDTMADNLPQRAKTNNFDDHNHNKHDYNNNNMNVPSYQQQNQHQANNNNYNNNYSNKAL